MASAGASFGTSVGTSTASFSGGSFGSAGASFSASVGTSATSAACGAGSACGACGGRSWGTSTGEGVTIGDLVGVAANIENLDVARESTGWGGGNDGCAGVGSDGGAEGSTLSNGPSRDGHVSIDGWQDLGAADQVDLVNQILLGRALECHNLEIVDNGLEYNRWSRSDLRLRHLDRCR